MDDIGVGERVGAILKVDNECLWLIGYGTYLGREIPPFGLLKDLGVKSPKIKLDSGEVIWGFECWWGREEDIKKLEGMLKVIKVDIGEIRKKNRIEVDMDEEFWAEGKWVFYCVSCGEKDIDWKTARKISEEKKCPFCQGRDFLLMGESKDCGYRERG